MPTNNGYSIGWLARCTDPYEFFPLRFLHVLLLRLVFKFTLSTHQAPTTSLERSDLQCFCIMWKTGVYWLMREGVECLVELVNGSKGVLIITKTQMLAVTHILILGSPPLPLKICLPLVFLFLYLPALSQRKIPQCLLQC